jgi:hypothetical protein
MRTQKHITFIAGVAFAIPILRTVRLPQILGVLRLIAGVVMTLPITAHAVLLEMPPASSSALVSPLVFSIGVPSAMVVVPIFLTGG